MKGLESASKHHGSSQVRSSEEIANNIHKPESKWQTVNNPVSPTRIRSNSDTKLSQCSVLLPTQNSDVFVQINGTAPASGCAEGLKAPRLMQKVTKTQLNQPDSMPLRNSAGRLRSNSNAQDYGSTIGTPNRTPLTPRRKRLIILQGNLALKVQQQLRQAWPGAWFALRLNLAFLRTYHSIRKYRQPPAREEPFQSPIQLQTIVSPATPPQVNKSQQHKCNIERFDEEFSKLPSCDTLDDAQSLGLGLLSEVFY